MPVLYLVGDSTVCNYDLSIEDRSFLYPRNGYGMWLNTYFKGSVYIKNLALGGRSSKSFLNEENYKYLCENLTSGDYLMIAFSHNDEKYLDEARFTYGNGDISDDCSFKYHLYNYYIKLALDRGATPILCTPIVRRCDKNEYQGDRVHVLGKVVSSGKEYGESDYPNSIRELAREFDITLIDMTALTLTLCKNAGAKKTIELFATTSKNKEDIDNTHLNSFGAKVYARVWCDALKQTDCELKNYLSDSSYNPKLSDRFENA